MILVISRGWIAVKCPSKIKESCVMVDPPIPKPSWLMKYRHTFGDFLTADIRW